MSYPGERLGGRRRRLRPLQGLRAHEGPALDVRRRPRPPVGLAGPASGARARAARGGARRPPASAPSTSIAPATPTAARASPPRSARSPDRGTTAHLGERTPADLRPAPGRRAARAAHDARRARAGLATPSSTPSCSASATGSPTRRTTRATPFRWAGAGRAADARQPAARHPHGALPRAAVRRRGDAVDGPVHAARRHPQDRSTSTTRAARIGFPHAPEARRFDAARCRPTGPAAPHPPDNVRDLRLRVVEQRIEYAPLAPRGWRATSPTRRPERRARRRPPSSRPRAAGG